MHGARVPWIDYWQYSDGRVFSSVAATGRWRGECPESDFTRPSND